MKSASLESAVVLKAKTARNSTRHTMLSASIAPGSSAKASSVTRPNAKAPTLAYRSQASVHGSRDVPFRGARPTKNVLQHKTGQRTRQQRNGIIPLAQLESNLRGEIQKLSATESAREAPILTSENGSGNHHPNASKSPIEAHTGTTMVRKLP